MEQYIKKSALVAELESLRCTTFTNFDEGVNATVQILLETLDTLEVKGVNLEKEYDNEFFKDPVFGKLVNRNAGISIAKYFFELGLKVAQKGEEV